MLTLAEATRLDTLDRYRSIGKPAYRAVRLHRRGAGRAGSQSTRVDQGRSPLREGATASRGVVHGDQRPAPDCRARAEVDTGEMDALVTYIASAGKHGRTACRNPQIRVSGRQRSLSRAARAVCWSGWYQRGPGEALIHTTPRFQRGSRDVHVSVLAVDDRASRQDFRAEPSGDLQCHRRGTTHRSVGCVAVDRGHGRSAVGADVDGVNTGGRTQQSQPAARRSTSAPPASGTSLTAS
jgi:hypothetical protein